jgi:signal transduction histidine kinase
MPLTNRRAFRYISLISILVCLLCTPVWAVDKLVIGDGKPNAYLPYRLDTVYSAWPPTDRPTVEFPIRTYASRCGSTPDSADGCFMTACNPAPFAETTSDLSVRICRHRDYFLETALRFTSFSFGTYRTTTSPFPGIVIGGYRNDSSFVARVRPGDSATLYFPISHGVDQDDDHVWRGIPGFVRALDYDNDGREEVFFWVDARRDSVPRDLVCIDPDAGKIEWMVPVASSVNPGQVFAVGDSLNPKVLISTYGMGQNIPDSLFPSDVGCVAVIDHTGKVLVRKFATKFSDAISLLPLPGDSLFVLAHTLPLLDSRAQADSLQSVEYLSLVDDHLNVRKSVELPMRFCEPWLSDYKNDGTKEIYTLTTDGTVRIYSQDLTLLAASGRSSLLDWVATLPSFGAHGEAFVISTTRGTEVFSHDFSKLAVFGDITYCEPFEFDDRGHMTSFIASGSKTELIAMPVKRNWQEFVSVFYYDYQIWVLSALFSLAVGLVVMNLYRSRVSRQRTALAKANSELAATHEALKQAQATIIAQEKYKQAKDMAGAFAHEIRNALFPADSALTKLVQLSDQPTSDPDRIRSLRESIRNSVSRAVSITEEISTYTKLDTLYAPETVWIAALVDDLVKGHGVMLEENSIAFSSDGPSDCTIRANRTHMGVVLSNLFLNSIHALQGRKGGAITITWVPVGSKIEIRFADNGCGIPPEQISRIFDAFFSTKATKGTGLGLATCKRIVEMYGGTIAVHSTPDQGTQFTLHMPTGVSVADTSTSSPSTHRSRHDYQ